MGAMRRVALVTCLAFACATARQQVPGSDLGPPPPQRLALAEPQLELWMEGSRAIDPAEEAQALAQSREALAASLDGRGFDAPDPDAVVVVRARALARTGERKRSQVASAVGIVFVVVALVVAAVLLSRSGSRSSSRGAPAALPAQARGAGGGPRPGYFAPRPYAPPPVGVFVGLSVAVPVGPLPPLRGLPPTEAWLAARGWFDGDEVEVSAELQDPRTGEVRWHRTLRGGVDPRDPKAVRGLVDAALEGLPQAPAAVPAAPPAGA